MENSELAQPHLDELIEFVQEKKRNNEITDKIAMELKDLLTNQTFETVNIIANGYRDGLDEIANKARFTGFWLGIIASVVTGLVGAAIYHAYFI
jgi:hypothetical protein